MTRLIAFIAVCAALRADSLEEILKRMDASEKTFQSVSANIKHISFTQVLNQKDEETGRMRLKRTKKGLVGIVEFDPPDPLVYHFSGGLVELYRPKNNSVEEYDFSKYKGDLDRALILGFGTSGVELNKDYEIKVIGPETVQGVATTHLELAPKSKEMKKLVMKVDLWIQDGKSYPVQERGTEPNGNSSTFIYSNIRINPKLPDSDYELKAPKDVRRLHPGK